MGDMQKRIMAELRSVVDTAGFQWIQEPNYANCGRVYIQKGAYEVVLSFCYSFQDGYADLQFYPPGHPPTMTIGFTDKKCLRDVHFYYIEAKKPVEQMFQWLKKHLAGLSKGREKVANGR